MFFSTYDKKIKIRTYRKGDVNNICRFLTDNSPHQRDIQFWIWINRILPEDDSIIYVAELDKNIIGHYAALPQTISYNNIEFKACLGVHALIHPEFRKRISIFNITNIVYENLKKLGMDFIYGFPNKKYRLISNKIDNWNTISIFKSLEKNIVKTHSDRYMYSHKKINITRENIYHTIYLINELIDRSISKMEFVSLKKTGYYYLIRYLLHPENIYQTYWLKKGNEIEGLVVIKKYKIPEENKTRGHLIDYIISPNLNNSDVIHFIEYYFNRHNEVHVISSWPINLEFKKTLLKLGYYENGFETYLGAKFLNENIEQPTKETILNFNNWDLPMGDSDAF